MKKFAKKITILLMAFAVAFTAFPAIDGSLDVHAASAKAPAQVKGVKVVATGQTTTKITWTKIKKNKNTKGYAILRNGRIIKRVGKNSSSFSDTGLKAGTKYTYTVRAYNTYKQNQYYNAKKGKWQKKKIKKAKTRKVTMYKYGKVSAAVSITTKAAPKLTLKLGVVNKNLVLSWTLTGGTAKSYKVYRNGSLIATVTETSYTEKTLPAGSYSWYVVSDGGVTSNAMTAEAKSNGAVSDNSGNNSGNTGSTTQYETVYDWQGAAHKFPKGDARLKDSKYNVKIDDSFVNPYDSTQTIVQKGGVAAIFRSESNNHQTWNDAQTLQEESYRF